VKCEPPLILRHTKCTTFCFIIKWRKNTVLLEQFQNPISKS
jgi:hypothetical protein